MQAPVVVVTVTKFHEYGDELIPSPRYSPDLARSDYLVCPGMKKSLGGKEMGCNEEVILKVWSHRSHCIF